MEFGAVCFEIPEELRKELAAPWELKLPRALAFPFVPREPSLQFRKSPWSQGALGKCRSGRGIRGEQILDLLIPTNSLFLVGKGDFSTKKVSHERCSNPNGGVKDDTEDDLCLLRASKGSKTTWKTFGEAPLPNAHPGRRKESPEGWEVLLVSLFIPKIMWDKIPPLLKKKIIWSECLHMKIFPKGFLTLKIKFV